MPAVLARDGLSLLLGAGNRGWKSSGGRHGEGGEDTAHRKGLATGWWLLCFPTSPPQGGAISAESWRCSPSLQWGLEGFFLCPTRLRQPHPSPAATGQRAELVEDQRVPCSAGDLLCRRRPSGMTGCVPQFTQLPLPARGREERLRAENIHPEGLREL